jgi:DNA helicase-2/ATP-dependent DNA helicase PcrA
MTGTLFHTWVEQRYGLVANTEIVDSLDGLIEELDAESPEALEQLQANFDKSRWASMRAREVESEIQVTIEQNTFICKIDAVFDVPEGDKTLPGKTIEIVDWKTGEPPKTDEEIAERALQLALYKMAYSLRHNIPEQQIAVCLYYVGHDEVLRPEVLNIEQVKAKWREVLDSF